MQTSNRDHYEKLTVQISKEEKELAKAYAKSHGITFQWWIGQLIRAVLKEAEKEADRV